MKPSIAPLTFIRFIAAFWVFLFHIDSHWPWRVNPFISNIINSGAVGMSLFFILSGFILTYNYYDQNPLQNYRAFIIKRLARIYPVYLLAMILFIPVLWAGLKGTPSMILGKLGFLVLTNVFLIQAWYPSLFFLWNDGGSWSLSVEMFCYVLFPLLIVLIGTLSLRKLLVLLLAVYILSVLPGLAAILYDSKPLFPTIYALPIYRLPEFIVGMIMCYLFLKYKLSHTQLMSILLLTTTAIFCWLGFKISNTAYIVNNNILIIPAFALVIFCLANLRTGWLFTLFNSRPAIFLGNVSYSFYLLQGFFIIPVYKFYKLLAGHFFFANNTMITITLFILSFLLSSASYLLVEKPCRRYLIARFTSKKLPVSSATLA